MTRHVALCAVLLLGCGGCRDPAREGQVVGKVMAAAPAEGNPFATDVAAIAEGRKLYLTVGCVGCHGVGGGGGMGKAILDDEWKFGSDDETLFKLVRGEVPNQTMPNVIGKSLSDAEIWKILAFVRTTYQGDPAKITWVKPPITAAQLAERGAGPGARATTEPVELGRELFTTHCVPCHGPRGRGDGPSSATLNPRPRDLSDYSYMSLLEDRYLVEIVSKGGQTVGKSPAMPKAELDAQQIGIVIAYVRTLSGSLSR